MTIKRITSHLLHGTQHGFFTRKGGASSGIFEGLNCGLNSSDLYPVVEINRSRVAHELDETVDKLITLKQTHSAKVLTVSSPTNQHPEGDALVTNTKEIILGVLTADCQPVLFYDPQNGVIGATHAGWRGALDGILENTINAMENLGASRNSINAVIGPCISQPTYEVGQEFFELFCDTDSAYSRFFSNSPVNNKYLFNLPQFGLFLLERAEISNYVWTGHCTYSDESSFFSYRRSQHLKQADFGRLLSAIKLDS